MGPPSTSSFGGYASQPTRGNDTIYRPKYAYSAAVATKLTAFSGLVRARRRPGVFGRAPTPYDGEVNETLPACPECSSDMTYEMGSLLVCPLCGHEWAPVAADSDEPAAAAVITDAFGTPLADGDSITIVKGLKVKGGSNVIKVGTKVRDIRLRNGVGDHDIEARIEGVTTQLKSSVVKKA